MADGIEGLRLALGQRQMARPARAPIPLLPQVRRRNQLTFEEIARRQQVLQRAQEKQQDARSLWEQTTDAVGGFVKGVGSMAFDIGKGVVSTPVKLVDFVQGDLSGGDFAKSMIPQDVQYALGIADQVASHSIDPAAMDRFRQVTGQNVSARYNPLPTQMGQSMGNTILDVRHPGRFADAVREGRIVDKIVEDVSNAAMVLGPVAKLAGAASGEAAAAGNAGRAAMYGRAAEVADALHTPGRSAMRGLGVAAEKVGMPNVGAGLQAGAQMAPLRAVAKGVGLGADSVFQRALQAGEDTLVGGAARGLRTKFPQFLTPEGRFMRQAARESQITAGREQDAIRHEAFRQHLETGGVTAEEGAAAALVNSVGPTNRILSDLSGLTPDEVRQVWAQQQLPEQGYTPEIDQLVNDYLDGTLDPEVRARIDQHVGTITNWMQDLEVENLTGRGRVSGDLDPQQLENGPVDAAMYGELNRMREAGTIDKAQFDAIEQAHQSGMAWEDIGQYAPPVGDLLQQWGVYPSRWRPAMREAKLLADAKQKIPMTDAEITTLLQQRKASRASIAQALALTADERIAAGLFNDGPPLVSTPLPFTPDELMAAGVADPQYLPGGRSNLFEKQSWRITNEPTNAGISGLQGTVGENTRVGAELQPYSLRTVAEQVGSARRTMALNEGVLKMMEDQRIPSAAQIVPPHEWSIFQQEAAREAASALPGKGATERAAYAQEVMANRVIDSLKERGYEIIVGDRHNPKVGDFNPGAQVLPEHVTPDAVVLPRGLKDAIHQKFKNESVPLSVLRYINRKFKGAVLPFSVRWQVGDLVGGAFMSWVGGGVPIYDLISGMRRLKKLSPEAEAATIHNKNFVDSGFAAQERNYWDRGANPKEPRTPIGKFQQKSFALNEAINHANRSGYLLAKLEKLLNEKGMSIDAVERGGGWNDPAVQSVIDEAVADANKTMGAFDRLSPAERRYMTTAFPFYAWTKHITTLAFRTLIDNPNRIAWTLRLGAMGTDPNQDLPEWLKGSITIPDAVAPDALFGEGDQLLPTQYLNPFNDVSNNPGYTPSGLMRSLSPGLKIPMATFLGIEPNPGDQLNPIRQITRPFGEDRNALTDGLQSVISTFPILREAQTVAPTGNIGGIGLGPHPRYHSGRNMVDKWDNPIDTSSRWLVPLRLGGIPLPYGASDAEQIQAVARKREESKRRKKKEVNKG